MHVYFVILLSVLVVCNCVSSFSFVRTANKRSLSSSEAGAFTATHRRATRGIWGPARVFFSTRRRESQDARRQLLRAVRSSPPDGGGSEEQNATAPLREAEGPEALGTSPVSRWKPGRRELLARASGLLAGLSSEAHSEAQRIGQPRGTLAGAVFWAAFAQLRGRAQGRPGQVLKILQARVG